MGRRLTVQPPPSGRASFPPFLFLSPKSAFPPASIKGLPVCSALLVMSLEIKELADLWSNVTMEIGDINHCLLGEALIGSAQNFSVQGK